MPPARNTCAAQPTSSGLGLHFTSPKKSWDPKKTQSFVHIPGIDAKHRRLLNQMAALMNPPVLDTETPSSSSAPPQSEAPMNIDDTMDYACDADSDDYAVIVDQPDTGASCPTDVVHEDLVRCLLPDKMSNNLHSSWKALIPTLVDAHLQYSARTHGNPLPEARPVISACAGHSCAQ